LVRRLRKDVENSMALDAASQTRVKLKHQVQPLIISTRRSKPNNHTRASHQANIFIYTTTAMNRVSRAIILACIVAVANSEPRSADQGSSNAIGAKSARSKQTKKLFKFTSKVGRCCCLLFGSVSIHSRCSTPTFVRLFLSLPFIASPFLPNSTTPKKVGEN